MTFKQRVKLYSRIQNEPVERYGTTWSAGMTVEINGIDFFFAAVSPDWTEIKMIGPYGNSLGTLSGTFDECWSMLEKMWEG